MVVILDEIRWAIDKAWDSSPTWVKFLFFFSIVLLIANILFPIIFMLTGTFCAGGVKYEGSPFKLWDNPSNAYAAFMLGNATNGSLEVHQGNFFTNTISASTMCAFRMPLNNSWRWYFNNNGGDCRTTCRVIDENSPYYNNLSSNSNLGMCEGDVYNKNDSDISFWCAAWSPRWSNDCLPPLGYHYSYAQNLYICDLANCTTTTAQSKFSEGLNLDGYEAVPQVDSVPTVGSVCSPDSNVPHFAVEGIELFKPTYWLLIGLIALMLWGLTKFKR